MRRRVLSLFSIRRGITVDSIQCYRCRSWNSKFRDRCWKCGEQLSV